MSATGAWRTLVPARIRQQYAFRLAVALLSVIAMTVLFGTMVHYQTDARLTADVTEDLSTTAAVQAETLDTWLTSVENQATLTSSHPVVTGGDTAAIRSHLRDRAAAGNLPEAVVAVHYYDAERGTILASSSPKMEGVSPAEQGAPFATDPPEFSGPDDTYVSDPFTVPVVDFPVVAVISPVEGREGKAIIYMVNLESRAEALTGGGNGGETLVVNDEGQYVSHPDTSKILTEFAPAGVDASALLSSDAFREGEETVYASAGMDSTDWTVVVAAPTSQAFALGRFVTSKLLGLILLTVVSLGLVGATIGSNTAISLRQLADKADRMAGGDLSVELSSRREDELGTLVRSFDEMRTSLQSSLAEAEQAREAAETSRAEAEQAREAAQARSERLQMKATEYGEVLQDVADGDLTRRVDPDSETEAMATVGRELNDALAEMEATMADVSRFAGHVADAAGDAETSVSEVSQAGESVAESVDEISTGAGRQDERLQTVETEMSNLSASAEEVAATVDEVAETSQEAAAVGTQGRNRAETALEEMDAVEQRTERTTEEMEALDDEMDEIGDIAELITDIAEQTNLLALNASIEAARTDAEGDGFAVVADEVKRLAEETADSATEVEERIARIQERTGDAVEEMRETGERVRTGVETVEGAIDSLERIVDHVDDVDDSIQEITAVVDDQARAAESVVDTVEEVAAISDQTSTEADRVAAAAEEQSTTLDEVGDTAEDLAARARRLRAIVDEFDTDVEPADAGATATTRTDGRAPQADGGADSTDGRRGSSDADRANGADADGGGSR